MMNWFTPTSSVKYRWSFLVVVEGLLVPGIPRAKPSGIPTPVRSRRRRGPDWTWLTPEDCNGRIDNDLHDLNGQMPIKLVQQRATLSCRFVHKNQIHMNGLIKRSDSAFFHPSASPVVIVLQTTQAGLVSPCLRIGCGFMMVVSLVTCDYTRMLQLDSWLD